VTEADWLDSIKPGSMLRFLGRKASGRKLRQFAVAVHREYNRIRPWTDVARARSAVVTAEVLAEGGPPMDAATRIRLGGYFILNPTGYGSATRMADIPDVPASFKCNALRDIFGNPFRPVTLDPGWLAWRGGTVRELARVAYEDRRLPDGTLDPSRLAVLADAPKNASCTDANLLGHLRGPGPHVRGCWALDLVLGRE
jgi:hypothetical protein